MNPTRNPLHNVRRLGAITAATCLVAFQLHAQLPFGQWEFNGNLNPAVGAALQYADGTGGPTQLGTVFNSTGNLGIPDINGTNAQVMKFPTCTNGMGYNMPTPPGDGSYVATYTLIADVLFGGESDAKLRPVIDTDAAVIVPGADLGVLAANGIGIVGGNPFGQILSNTWYRIGFVVENNIARMFVNGSPVGSQALSALQTFRLDLTANSTALILANTGSGTAASGYINSLQLRGAALTDRNMQAMGGPSAEGIPQTIPPVPSFIAQWIPSSAFANKNTDVGVVIDDGDTTINDSSIVLKLDNVVLANAVITRNGDQITVKTNLGNLNLGNHTVVVDYVDSAAGAKSFTNTFAAVLFYEDFDQLTLGPNVDETLAGTKVWTNALPAGWTRDNSGVPGLGDPALDGVTEWAGWSFANKDWWVQAAGDQGRVNFVNGKNTVAIMDPDEWDDANHAVGYITSYLKTPLINITGLSANTIFLKFDSSWDYEAQDDCGGTKWPPCPATNNQTALITVSYNSGSQVQVMKWDSVSSSPTFHGTAYNESVTLLLNNPASATNVVVSFGLLNAGNDWWWAIDNVQVSAGPAVTTQPVSIIRDAGTPATFTVVAQGSGTLSYQWQYNGGAGTVYTNLPNEKSASLSFTAETNKAGSYRVLVTDTISTTPSAAASLTVIAAPLITQQPVSQTVNAGVSTVLSIAARGRAPITYQWSKGGNPISGATGTSVAFPAAQAGDAGQYRCEVSNPDATVLSVPANLKVVSSITDELVVHLKFDNDYADASGRGNNATAVGAPAFVAGKIGSAMQYTSARDGSSFNYATLGYPADLQFAEGTPFSVSFWFKLNPGDRAGDPALIGNKNWNSGNNCGFAIFTTGPLRWTYRELDVTDTDATKSRVNTRKDSGSTSSNIQDGNWHHCVVTFNRGGNAGAYVDGQLIHVGALATANATYGGTFAATTIDNVPANARSGGANAINIGQDGVGTYTDGGAVGITNAVIDDVGIWRRTLTPGEVAAIYTAGNAGNPLNTAAPVTNPRPLDPSISVSGANVVVNKGNTALYASPALTGPWTEVTGARGTNTFVEPATTQRHYRGAQP